MKLHYNLFSPNSRKVAFLAHYIDAKIEYVTVDVPAGGCETPEFLALNPNGLIPVLQDGDFVVWESNAIMQYLAEKTGAAEVWPADFRKRVRATQWQFWETNHFGRAAMMIGFERFMKKVIMGEGPDESVVEQYLGYFHAHARVMDEQLGTAPFLIGPKPTLPDFSVAGAMQFAAQASLPLADYPNIKRWWEQMRGFDAWKKTELKLG